MIGFPSDWLGQVVSTGIFEPLNGYKPTTSAEDPRFLKALSVNNKLYAFPLTAEALALVYNKALVPSPPATWSEFLKVAQANTTSSRSGFLYDIDNPYYNYGFVKAYGGYIFREKENGFDVNDIGLATPGALKAAQFVSDFQQRHRLIPAGITDARAKAAFLEGRLAFWLAGPWEIGDILTAGIDVGVTTFPTPPQAIQPWTPIVTISGVAVTSVSPQKALAVQFAQQLSVRAAQINLYQVSGRIPASPGARQALKNDPIVAGFSAALRAGTALPTIPEIDQVWEPWATASSQLLSQPPEQARQILNDLVQRIRTRIKGSSQGK
ncbi:extracellular solute-binding protein [Deinococcus oregonensis]|uniref:Extracellular solute-binding protein n=1 Tax=Deinococcus oregonensis TaxID=1805970 RepID=A0ABV6AXV6_9DEIO